MKGLLLLLFVATSLALNNGLGKTPQMGYNSWYDVLCSSDMNERVIRQTADALIQRGLHSLGYTYVNLDDCWAGGRAADGTIYADRTSFPSGISSLAQYVHSKGLQLGVYTDRGNETCGGRPGSLHHEKIDALTYAKWGVDYLKEDSCYATQDHEAAFAEYGAMRDALNATGRPIFFSLCGWNDWYAPVGYGLGNSWRIGPDDQQWENVINNVNIDVKLSKYAGPGGWNDPCLLLGDRLSYEQAKTQFSLWSVLAAPLLISANIRNMTDQFLNIYKNQEVIAVNQDLAGKQGFRVAGQDLDINANLSINVIARPLHTGSWAAVFVNVGKSTSDIVCKSTCLKMMGFSSKDQIKVRDLWTHKDEKTIQGSYTAHSVMGGGSSKMVLFTRVK